LTSLFPVSFGPWVVEEVVACCMLNMFLWINTSYVAWFSTVQTKIVYMSTLFFMFYEWFELCLVDLHGVVIGCRHRIFGLQHEWHEWRQCRWWFLMFFLLTFKKLIITINSLHNYLIQGHGIKHGQKRSFMSPWSPN